MSKNSKKPIHEKMISQLELPKDLMLGAAIVTITGRKEVLVENYKGIIELCGLLLEYDVAAEEIDIDENGHFTVYIDNALRVGFGIPVLLEEKAAEVANILPELRNMEETEQIRGILHLENYDSTKNSIIFTKEN